MKQLHLLFFTILFSFFTQTLFGQTNKPCNNFDCAYKKAETFLKQAAYQKALDNLDSAEGYLTDTNTKEKEDIKNLRRQLFVAIEKEKEDAKIARDEAENQRGIARAAEDVAKKSKAEIETVLRQVEIEKAKSDSLYGVTEFQKNVAENQKIYAQQQVEIADAERKRSEKSLQILENLFSLTKIQQELSDKRRILVDSQSNLQNKLLINFLKKKYGRKGANLVYPLIFMSAKLDSFDLSLEFENASRNQQINELKIQLKEIYDQKISYSSIEELDLRSKSLVEVPSDILTHKRLKILKIGNNKINILPKDFIYFYNLISLELDSNKFTVFPSEVFSLYNLVNLNLSYNQLSSLSSEITKLTRLRILSLDFNKLIDCPVEIGRMINLEALLLRGNDIIIMPTSIEKLIKLKYLDLRDNPIPKEEQEKIKKLLPNCKVTF